MTSSDGFCSALSFAPGELGLVYPHPPGSLTRQTPTPISIAKANSASSTPQPTPVGSALSNSAPFASVHSRRDSSHSNSSAANPPSAPPLPPHPSPSPSISVTGHYGGRPASPARSMSASSIATEASFARVPDQNAPPAMNNPTPSMSSMPSLAVAGSSNPGTGLPLFTPPQTPAQGHGGGASSQGSNAGVSAVGTKRESNASRGSESEDQGREKRRRIAPTPVTQEEPAQTKPPATTTAGNGS